jgi:hypothetical protein
MPTTIADLALALKASPADPATAERFLAKLKQGTEPKPGMGPCILWTGTPHIYGNQGGYGAFKADGATVAPYIWLHRQLHPGKIPDGYDRDHTCHDGRTCPGGPHCPHRLCVVHIAIKTHADNLRRGASFAGQQFRQDYCGGSYGVQHDLRDPKNVYRPPGRENERHCIPCNNEASRRYKERRHALRARGQEAEQREIGQMSLL